MSSLTVSLELRSVAPRRELVVAGAVTAGIALLLLAFGPAPGDAPAHLYRTLLVRDGVFFWDNLWYAGSYPLASYSLLYYLPAALVGNLVLVFAASVIASTLFASISFREWGAVALWPSRAFAVLAAAPMFTGLYSYSLGFAALLAALRAVQAQRTGLAIGFAALTLGFSPLAFVFLSLILLVVLLARRRVTARCILLMLSLVLIAGVQIAVLILFPSPGVYPFNPVDLGAVLTVCGLGALLARSAERGRVFVLFFVLWGLGSVLAYLVPTPVGDNWTRLSAFVFPLMLLTASLTRFRPRLLTALALAAALAYNLTPYLMQIPYRLDDRPASAPFWQPALSYLDTHASPDYRTEVVPTAAHWEAYWLPRSGYALARGWYRQLDIADNPVLYRRHLTPAAYRRWLRSVGVKFILLPATKLDPDGGTREAALVQSNQSGLRTVFRDSTWTIFQLPDPSPLITGPSAARITRLDHTTISGWVAAPGRYLLRVRFSPYWQIQPEGSRVSRARNRMTALSVPQQGPFTLRIPQGPEALFDSVSPPTGASTLH